MNIVEFMSSLAKELPNSVLISQNEIEEEILRAIKKNDSEAIKFLLKIDGIRYTNERTVTNY